MHCYDVGMLVCTDDIKPMMMHIGLIRIDFRFKKKCYKRNAFETEFDLKFEWKTHHLSIEFIVFVFVNIGHRFF